MKTYIGIDNGVSGSIGIIKDGFVDFMKTPVFSCQDYTKAKKGITRLDSRLLSSILRQYQGEDCLVSIERPLVNPGRFIATTSALRCHEATLIVLELLQLPYFFIDSKEWQRNLLPRGTEKDELKKMSLEIGSRLFPQYKEIKHPDRDGLLIAEYCKRKNL